MGRRKMAVSVSPWVQFMDDSMQAANRQGNSSTWLGRGEELGGKEGEIEPLEYRGQGSGTAARLWCNSQQC